MNESTWSVDTDTIRDNFLRWHMQLSAVMNCPAGSAPSSQPTTSTIVLCLAEAVAVAYQGAGRQFPLGY